MAKVPITKRYYEPIPGETHKAWLAFCCYRDMGFDRSLDKAWRQTTGKMGRHARHWAGWSVQNHWVSRCRAFDTAVMNKARRQVEAERITRHAGLFNGHW